MRRKIPKKGDYLFVDDNTGFVHPASESVIQWDGALVHFSQNDQRNPQEFVHAEKDPEPLRDVRPRVSFENTYCPVKYRRAGGNVIDLQPGVSALDEAKVGTAAVGCTLQVYP